MSPLQGVDKAEVFHRPSPDLHAEPITLSFLCAAAWGINPHHRFVHSCARKIDYTLTGNAWAPAPHDGEHVCRCGDRRAVGKTPRL